MTKDERTEKKEQKEEEEEEKTVNAEWKNPHAVFALLLGIFCRYSRRQVYGLVWHGVCTLSVSVYIGGERDREMELGTWNNFHGI